MLAKVATHLLIRIALAVPVSAQWEDMLNLETEAAAVPAVSPLCSAGVVYDDGVFQHAYGGPGTKVMKFVLPAGTIRLDQVCVCLTRLPGDPASMNFEIVVFDDDNPVFFGWPGTFLGAVAATATSIPVSICGFYSVNLSASGIVLPDNIVYVGVRAPGGSFVGADNSPSTPQREGFVSNNGGFSWDTWASQYSSPPRALAIRVDPGASTAICTPSATAMCLNNNRFKVEATFQAPGGGPGGQAQVVKLTQDTGYFWFFDASNVEAVIKVLNACSFNQRYWVFAGGLTNVRTVITVTDTRNGTFKTYTNPQNTKFQPIQDTSAFATCP